MKNLEDLYETAMKLKPKDNNKKFKWNGFDVTVSDVSAEWVEFKIDLNNAFGGYEVVFYRNVPKHNSIQSAAENLQELRYSIDKFFDNFRIYQKGLKKLDIVLDPFYAKE